MLDRSYLFLEIHVILLRIESTVTQRTLRLIGKAIAKLLPEVKTALIGSIVATKWINNKVLKAARLSQ